MSICLSICIPTYNRFSSLKNQVEFLLSEGITEFSDVEVIIANNGSVDETKMYLLNEIDGRYPNITVVNNTDNIGLINNIRMLRDMAAGKFVWFIGDDDLLCPGIVKKVISVACEYEVEHIFINHAIIRGNITKTEKVFSGKCGYIVDGLDAFEQLTNFSTEQLGGLMFITANVYNRKLTIDADKILSEVNEAGNLALPLGYSLYCSLNGGCYVVGDVYIYDQVANTTWSDQSLLLHCRDMLAICDKLAEHEGCGDRIRTLLINNIPTWSPEYRYVFYKHKFKQDNYALKWFWKYYKAALAKDLFCLFCNIPQVLKRRLMKVLRRV